MGAFFAESDQQMQSLTKEQAGAALAAFVEVDKLIVVTAGDFGSLKNNEANKEE